MRNTLAIIVFLCPVFAFAQPQQQLFVPASPLTAQELAEQRERLKEDLDLTDAELDDLMGDGSTTFTYRDRDIVTAFPELRGDRLSACANSMAGGATELVRHFMVHTRRGWQLITRPFNCVGRQATRRNR